MVALPNIWLCRAKSRDGMVIKLADNAAGYGDPKKPKPLMTMYEGERTGEAFGNAVRNLSFDTGKGNAGAIGLQFMCNNFRLGRGCGDSFGRWRGLRRVRCLGAPARPQPD